MKRLNYIISLLQKENYKGFYLSLMRVMLSIFLLKEILFKQATWVVLYSNQSSLQFNTHSTFLVFGIDIFFLKAHYLFIISIYIFCLLLFLFGIGKNVIAFLSFALLFLLQKINNAEVNGGDVLARFLLFCFCFANAYQYFCINKKKTNTATENVVSNLAALSMMMQLCIAYLLAFYHKIQNPYWQDGSAMYYILNTKAFMSTTFNVTLSHQTWLVYLTTYFTLALELLFPILIWFKKCRKPLIILGFALHLGIYFLMMLYNLQFVFLCIYGLFLSNTSWLQFCTKRLKFLKISA